MLICLFLLTSCDGAARVKGTIVNEMGEGIHSSCFLELYLSKNNELIRRMEISNQFDRDFTISPTYHKYYMIIRCEDYPSYYKTETYRMGGSEVNNIDLGTIVLDQQNAKENNIKEKFDTLYVEWRDYIAQPRIKAMSNSKYYINCKPYKEIIEMGSPVIPFIIKKMETAKLSGGMGVDCFLWYAIRDITGVDLTTSKFWWEQDMAEKYINWWKEKENN
jgi:hypothetical protein